MLGDNIKNFRKSKGLSQEELALKLNVVRQTVSKWENGLSVPDSEMIIRIAEELDTSVVVLLEETIKPVDNSELRIIANKLAIINDQIAKKNEARRKIFRIIFIIVSIIATSSVLGGLISVIYFQTAVNDINASTSVIGGAVGPTSIIVSRKSFQFFPFVLSLICAIASFIGIYKTRKK